MSKQEFIAKCREKYGIAEEIPLDAEPCECLACQKGWREGWLLKPGGK